MPLEHCRTEGLEHGHIAVAVFCAFNFGRHSLCQIDSASLHHNIYVVILPSQETITHIASYHESPHPGLFRDPGDYPEDRAVKESFCYRRTHNPIPA